MEVAINSEVTADIAKAEGFSMPVLLILLLVIFGSLAAASLPLAIGGVAILGSFTVLRLLTMATTVSVYSLNITTILGLGLGIDYGLFMVTRFREELHRQPTVEQAVARTVATAGRTVAVSGVTVAVALTSLMLFPEDFLRSMGYGGVATVAVDVLAALIVLPALLAVLGHRVNALRIRRSVAAAAQGRGGPGLVPAGPQRHAPARGLRQRDHDRRCWPWARRSCASPGAVPTPGPCPPPRPSGRSPRRWTASSRSTRPTRSRRSSPGPRIRAQLTAYVHRIDAIPGVTGAQVTGAKGGVIRVEIGYTPAPVSPVARQIVTQIRALTPPPGTTVLVGGTTAGLVDELASLGSTLPWMALLVCVSTFVLLFLAFGSVVLPVKAIVMNVLSLAATFGVVVWIFQ